MKYSKDEIELAKYVFLNWPTILGIFCLVLSCTLIWKVGLLNELFFLYSLGLAIFIFGVTLGYNNKSIKDQLELKNDLKLIKLKLDDNNYQIQKPEKKINESQETDTIKPEPPNFENIRVFYENYNERNLELASYIRLLDAGIWGFLGLIFIELFKDHWEMLPQKIVIFSILFLLSMLVWRYWANKYNDDIVEGYIKILRCECILDIPKEISLKNNLISKMCCFYPNRNRIEEYKLLIKDLESGKKPDTGHRSLNYFAYFCEIIAFFGIIAGLVLWNFRIILIY